MGCWRRNRQRTASLRLALCLANDHPTRNLFTSIQAWWRGCLQASRVAQRRRMPKQAEPDSTEAGMPREIKREDIPGTTPSDSRVAGGGWAKKKPGRARLFGSRLKPLLLFCCDFGVSACRQHDNGHRRSVTRTRTCLQDAQVATRPILEAWAKVGKQKSRSGQQSL